MPRKKKEKPNVVWSLDSKYGAHKGEIENPLYRVDKEGRYFHVKYYGVCGVYVSTTLEDAKKYIYGKVTD